MVVGLGGLDVLSLKGNAKRHGGFPSFDVQPAKNSAHLTIEEFVLQPASLQS
jgi:hypothetical protein